MRLQWKYTLIINGFILAAMSVFFVINDRMVKRESVLSVIRDYARGAAMREIAGDIQERITFEDNADRLAKIIRSMDLQKSGLEMVDINVMDQNGVVIAGLTERALYEQLDTEGLEKIKSRQTRVRYPPKGYYGHWVIEYTLPYIRSSSSQGDIELGALQIIFSAQGIASYSRRLRMEYLFYIAIIAAAFTLFIIPLTSYLIVRRLERLMETIAAVQAGDATARARDSSKDEIGRLSRSFNSMIEQISSEHASRLQALGNLAAGVAHGVKNPLNSISMTIQYLKDTIDSDPDSEAQECLDVMTQQVAELDHIVEDFLQLTRPVEMNLRPSDLNAFLADMMRSFATSLEIACVKLKTNYSIDAIYVKIDRDKMRQAISNVVINALQAMPDGGQLRIGTDRDALHKAAIIEVSDTGGGISQENLDRIFEPYFTTKPDGTGLGLAVTYRLVEAHGGDIRVENSEGQGATFRVTLPYSENSTDRSSGG